MTLEEIDTNLSTLRGMVAKGVLSVRSADGSHIAYRTMQELLAAVGYWENQRSIFTGTTPAVRVRPQFFMVRAVRD